MTWDHLQEMKSITKEKKGEKEGNEEKILPKVYVVRHNSKCEGKGKFCEIM